MPDASESGLETVELVLGALERHNQEEVGGLLLYRLASVVVAAAEVDDIATLELVDSRTA